MRNRTSLLAIPLLALVLTGCVPGSDQAKAHAACIDSAKDQLPKSAEQIDTSKLEIANMDDALRELADNPLPPDPKAGTMYSTTGDIWWRDGNGDNSASVLCLVIWKDGQPEKPVEAIVTF